MEVLKTSLLQTPTIPPPGKPRQSLPFLPSRDGGEGGVGVCVGGEGGPRSSFTGASLPAGLSFNSRGRRRTPSSRPALPGLLSLLDAVKKKPKNQKEPRRLALQTHRRQPTVTRVPPNCLHLAGNVISGSVGLSRLRPLSEPRKEALKKKKKSRSQGSSASRARQAVDTSALRLGWRVGKGVRKGIPLGLLWMSLWNLPLPPLLLASGLKSSQLCFPGCNQQ